MGLTKSERQTIADYYERTLIENVERFFENMELPAITGLISEMMFFICNPDESKELSKEDTARLACCSFQLLEHIAIFYTLHKNRIEVQENLMAEAV